MVQIRLTVAFVLAAAAIAPVAAYPLGEHEGGPHHREGRGGMSRHESHEGRGRFPGRHEGREGHGGFPGQGGLGAERHHRQSHREQADPNVAPSRREYFEEFDLRDLLGEEGLLTKKVDALEKQDGLLQGTDNRLTSEKHRLQRTDSGLLRDEHHLHRTDGNLLHEEHHLRHADGRLRKEDERLTHRKHRLEGEDHKLAHTKHTLDHEDHKLAHSKHTLEREDDKLAHTKHHLEHEDGKLGGERKTLLKQNKVLDAKLHKNKVLTAKEKLLGLKVKGAADQNKLSTIKGKIVPPKKGSVVASKENVVPKDDVHASPAHAIAAHANAKLNAKLATREFDDMFERDFEVEFDARDFEDLYLD